uniref:Uncharacterized protein n=1 Tax=Aegilops tauschii TaxID=37682 RepID=M8BB26_AEGTA
MALVNRNNKRRTMAIAFLVLVMMSACTLPSCHAKRGDAYCVDIPQGHVCTEPDCMDMCSRIERRQHSCCWAEN